MNDLTPKKLKSEAASALAAGNPRPIVARYTAVYLAVGLVLALSSLVCSVLIENTGGLGDMTTRTVISTVEMLISLAGQIFTPLWTVGITFCALGFARRQNVENRHLLGGVRRWAVLLRLFLCQAVLYFAVAYSLLLVLMPLYLLTPWGQALLSFMESTLSSTMTVELTAELQQQMLAHMGPLYAVWIPLLVGSLVFLVYQFRLALYRVLDEDRPGAIRAMLDSCKHIHRHRLQLLKLDLSYWWYYLALGLLNCVLWIPDLLAALEVALPVSSDVAYLLCYVVYAIGIGALYLTSLAKVETAYALFYDTLLHLPRPARTQPTPTPPALPTNTDRPRQ